MRNTLILTGLFLASLAQAKALPNTALCYGKEGTRYEINKGAIRAYNLTSEFGMDPYLTADYTAREVGDLLVYEGSDEGKEVSVVIDPNQESDYEFQKWIEPSKVVTGVAQEGKKKPLPLICEVRGL